MGLLLGMVLGATLVILILKARGQDVLLFSPPKGQAGNEPVLGRGGSGGRASHHHGGPAPATNSSSTSSSSGGGGGMGHIHTTNSSSSALTALRRIASQTGLGGSGTSGGVEGRERHGSLDASGLQTSGGSGRGRSRGDSARFAQTLSDPRYNGVKLIDWTGTQIPFNEVVDFENEFFVGRVLFMLRTKPEDPRYVAHFAGKQRLFEMQIQGHFKQLPEGVLYMGAELTERMHMGLVTKTVAGMILTFARRVLKNLHYSFGDKGDAHSADEIELPHLTFPLSRGMDRLVITPPGEDPPPLGREFDEPDDIRIPRRGGKGEEPQFVLGPTYSMSFHSMYMDFSQWQLVNIAGQKSIDLSGYFGDSSVHIVVYDLDPVTAAASGDRHRRCDKRYFYHCELMNSGKDALRTSESEAATTRRLVAPRSSKEAAGVVGTPVAAGGAPTAGAAGGLGGSASAAGVEDGTTGGGGLAESEGEEEEEEEEEQMLGSGVYVRSGDIVPLLAATSLASASNQAVDDASVSLASSTGGWACVTEGKGYCIARPGAAPLDVHLIKVGGTSSNFRSDFLCNGDVVILRNSVNGKYLSVYKGWWLWWTPNPPSSSSSRAHFVIHALEDGERLTVGRAFKLRHNKWASYEVGISDSVNSEYGGRMLGLYQTSKSKRMFQSRKSKTWVSPMVLKFQAPRGEESAPPPLPKMPLDDGSMVVVEGVQVRMRVAAGDAGEEQEEEEEEGVPPESPLDGVDPFFAEKTFSPEEVEEGMVVDVPAWIEMVHRHKKKPQLAYALRVRFRNKAGEDVVRWMALRTGIDLAPVIQMQRRQQLHAAALAAEAAAGTGGGAHDTDASDTDELDMDQSKPFMLQPPSTTTKGSKGALSKEGKSGGGGGPRSRVPSMDAASVPPLASRRQPLQHQNPADQSVRLLAQLLEEINRPSCPLSPPLPSPPRGPGGGCELDEYLPPPSCKTALYSVLKRRNFLDAWFLTGTAADMAVTVPIKPSGPALQQSMVARALWESHWREEWMVLYASHVSFFAMGTKKPGWSVFLHDILAVRVPPGASKLRSQFPGKFFLGLETLGRVHYLCFVTEAIQESWLTALSARVGGQATYEIPVGVIISDPREAFVLKSGQWRPSSRIILNARRMSFDVPASAATAALSMSPSQLSEKALRMVYDLSPDSGTERLVAFLDLCSSFRVLPLHLLDLASDEALAFFLNIYHTLLQHALLLLGPPSSKDWAAFFTSVSYEIGPDVFSLTEIEHCVLRGGLSRPRSVPRHMASPPHAEDDHYRYALGKADFRVNFALVNGSISAPPFVTVFRASRLDEQLDKAFVRFVDYTIKVDTRKRTVVLPKVCDIYRADFSPAQTSKETIKVCLRFLDRTKWERISWLLAGAKTPSIKYTTVKAKCHETLCLIEDRLSDWPPVPVVAADVAVQEATGVPPAPLLPTTSTSLAELASPVESDSSSSSASEAGDDDDDDEEEEEEEGEAVARQQEEVEEGSDADEGKEEKEEEEEEDDGGLGGSTSSHARRRSI